MGGIALCSVVALALFLERMWSLRDISIIPIKFSIEVEELVSKGKKDEAITCCKKEDTPLARILLMAIQNAGKKREEIKEAIEEKGRYESARLDRFVDVIGTIAVLTPLLGLLGTVSGMIDLFSDISAQEEVKNIGILASGIYKALYTTAAGLTVAIPALIFHKVVKGRVNRLILNMETISLKILDMIKAD